MVYGIHAIVAADERRTFLARSAAGMERAVKEGRFPGGICPLGYVVEGEKNKARLVPSEETIWGEWTAADLVRHIYQWLGVEGWSCRIVADYLNSLGVPTAYQHMAPGQRRAERGTGLQAKWRAGRICNLVVNTIYKGTYRYGKRSKKLREIWEVEVPRLVSDELWQAAQEALARNRIIAKNTPHRYLLTGLIKCGDCGKSYCATHGRGYILWWRCNGKMTSRYDAEGRCQSKAIKSTEIEPIIWQDIERFLLNPGDLIKDLEAEKGNGSIVVKAEKIGLEAQLKKLEQKKNGFHHQHAEGLLTDDELRKYLGELEESKANIQKRLDELNARPEEPGPIPIDLLEELRRRLENGLSEEQRQEIARLLVKNITVKTITEDGNRRCLAEVTYRFAVAVSSCTDRDS
jgi:site-specific DNA recombinase